MTDSPGSTAAIWNELRETAERSRLAAYAPYSDFLVGAAAEVDDGRIVAGCNVENAGYGVTLCAECGLVGQLHLSGGGRLRRFVCVGAPRGEEPRLVMPCGRCRQLLWENGGAELRLLTPSGERGMQEVLPDAFGPDDLA
ncbi:cytidine deaminase [Nocardioides sp.]|uniref:cytidine deaminase n=1 Tax=Nocardioides sp. TaxID=35761 RepID=UPI0035177060